MLNKRIEYIDIARGIGILLVALGHSNFQWASVFAYHVIYSFHMPLFFFLSGYFFNPFITFVGFVKKRFNSLLKPFLFTIFLIYFTAVSFEKMSFKTALARILKSLYGTGYYLEWVQLWFLPHLFVVSLYAFFLLALVNKINNRFLRWGMIAATLGLAALILNRFYPFSIFLMGKPYELFGLPFSLDLVFLSGFFFILGGEVRKNIPNGFFDNILVLAITGFAVLLLNYFSGAVIDFNTRKYDSFPINTVEAIVGIFFVLCLSRQIELRTTRLASLFRYFGQISLVILLFHVPIQDFWGQKVFAVINNKPLSIGVGFLMGVAGSALIYELLFKANPIASFWIGREVAIPEKKESAD